VIETFKVALKEFLGIPLSLALKVDFTYYANHPLKEDNKTTTSIPPIFSLRITKLPVVLAPSV